MSNLGKIVANNLRVMRTVANLKQGELAEKANVSQSTIAKIEAGKKTPSLRTLESICKPLNVEVWQFLKAKAEVKYD